MKRLTALFIAVMLLLPCTAFADSLTTNGSFEIDLNALPYRTEDSDAPVVYYISDITPEIEWLADGMSMGSAAAFMITGPATKITNLGAMKIALGWKRFILYLLFVMIFAWMTGIIVDILVVP